MKRHLSKAGIFILIILGIFTLGGCGQKTESVPTTPKENNGVISSEGQTPQVIDEKVTKEAKKIVGELFDDIENGKLDQLLKYYTQEQFKVASGIDLKDSSQKKAVQQVFDENDFDDEFTVQPIGGASYRVKGVVETPYFGDQGYTPDDIKNNFKAIVEGKESMGGYEFGLEKIDGKWQIVDDNGFLRVITGELGSVYAK